MTWTKFSNQSFNNWSSSGLYVETICGFLCEKSIFKPCWVSYLLWCFPILSRGIVVGQQQRCLQSEDRGNGFKMKAKIWETLSVNILTSNNDLFVSSVVILVGLFQQKQYSTNVHTSTTTNVNEYSLIWDGNINIKHKFER